MCGTYIIIRVNAILTSDMKREMPVFGLVQGIIVTGIIVSQPFPGTSHFNNFVIG